MRRQYRMPALYRPGTVYFWGGLLLCLSFALTLGAVEDSYLRHQWAWFWGFVAAELGCVAMYGLTVRWWLHWIRLTGDDEPYDNVLQCSCERDDCDQH